MIERIFHDNEIVNGTLRHVGMLGENNRFLHPRPFVSMYFFEVKSENG